MVNLSRRVKIGQRSVVYELDHLLDVRMFGLEGYVHKFENGDEMEGIDRVHVQFHKTGVAMEISHDENSTNLAMHNKGHDPHTDPKKAYDEHPSLWVTDPGIQENILGYMKHATRFYGPIYESVRRGLYKLSSKKNHK